MKKVIITVLGIFLVVVGFMAYVMKTLDEAMNYDYDL